MTGIENYIKNVLDQTYKFGTNNHIEHNSNPLYWEILIGDLTSNPEKWKNKTALDFGCGKGRNVTNMKDTCEFARVDGVDISQPNIDYCIETYSGNSNFYKNNGKDLGMLPDNEYDFIMSTIVFQHICVHELRYSLKKEIYRVLKEGGVFSFQMGYGDISFTGHTHPIGYFDNVYDARGSNGAQDVRVTDINELISDLESIGFKNITYTITEPYNDGGHPQWVYVRCEK